MHTWTYQTERYRFADLDDIHEIAAMLADPEVGRWLWFTPISAEGTRAFFAPLLEAQAQVLEQQETPETLPRTAVFAVEKLFYTIAYVRWHFSDHLPMAEIFATDAFAGSFFTLYGVGDFGFALFFVYVFLRFRASSPGAG